MGDALITHRPTQKCLMRDPSSGTRRAPEQPDVVPAHPTTGCRGGLRTLFMLFMLFGRRRRTPACDPSRLPETPSDDDDAPISWRRRVTRQASDHGGRRIPLPEATSPT